MLSAICFNLDQFKIFSSGNGLIVGALWVVLTLFNPSPDTPILGSFNSAANKNMMSKIWTNGDTII